MYKYNGKKLKLVIFCLADQNPPYLDEVLDDLEKNGIGTAFVESDMKTGDMTKVPDECFVITDVPAGRFFAENSGIGYAAFIPDGDKTFPCENALCVIEGFDEITADFIEKLFQRYNGIPWKILETKRTIIRELTLDDIDELYELYSDPMIKKFIPPLYEKREDEIEFERAYIEKMYGVCGFGYWLVLDKRSGDVIGRAGISPRTGYDKLELGYLIKEKYRGQGIAEEICRAILAYGRDYLEHTTYNAFIQADNTDSIRLAEKLGFKRIGEAFEEGKIMQIYRLEME